MDQRREGVVRTVRMKREKGIKRSTGLRMGKKGERLEES